MVPLPIGTPGDGTIGNAAQCALAALRTALTTAERDTLLAARKAVETHASKFRKSTQKWWFDETDALAAVDALLAELEKGK